MKKFLSEQEIAVIRVIESLFSSKGGEIKRRALEKLYLMERKGDKEKPKMLAKIRAINNTLPKKLQIQVNRGFRDYYLKFTPTTLKALKKLEKM